MEANKVFGQGAKAQEGDKLNIDSIIARLLEGKKEQQQPRKTMREGKTTTEISQSQVYLVSLFGSCPVPPAKTTKNGFILWLMQSSGGSSP
jgi:hypothetical protein